MKTKTKTNFNTKISLAIELARQRLYNNRSSRLVKRVSQCEQ